MKDCPINLCDTVENRPQYETLKCTVPHRKRWVPRFVFDETDPDYMSREFLWSDCHEWSDHAGGLQGGTCTHCGKTLKEVRVRINPKTGNPVRKGGLARAISTMHADVPPMVDSRSEIRA